MAKNILVLSCDFRETRAALIEDGIIAELHIERKGRQSSTVGNVYLGKVTRVLPGLQAAFIDIGQERAAFLHVEDLIRPDDFDEYLAGGRKLARTNEEHSPSESDADTEGDVPPAGESAALLDPNEAHAEAMIAVEAEESIVVLETTVTVSATDEGDIPSSGDRETSVVVETSQDLEEPMSGAASSDAPPVYLPPPDDLETTVSYANWPAADQPASARGGVKSRNGQLRKSRSSVPPPPVSAPTSPIAAPISSQASLFEGSSTDDVTVDAAPSGHSLHSSPILGELPEDEDDDDDLLDVDGEDDEEEGEEEGDAEADSGEGGEDDEPAPAAEATPATTDDDDDDLGDLPGFTITEPGEPVPRAPAPARAGAEGDRGGSRGGRRRRGRGRGGEPGAAAAPGGGGGGASAGGGGGSRGGQRGRGGEARSGGGGGSSEARGRTGGRDRRGGRGPDRSSGGGGERGAPGRISKTTPIREVVREGQEIIVQVTKDPIGTKGARCSSHISLPGRYVVYLPTVDHIGISKRIGSDKERARLREAIEAMKPPSGGLIVRTVAEGLTKKGLKQDVGYLVRLWGEIAKKREGAHSPYVLSSELDLVLKVARDLFTDEVDEVVIDDKQQFERLCRFVEMFAPDRVKDVKFYDEDEPIFDEYGIEDEIQRALSRKVPLPSGGYLIIDQAEALTAIDVNTGRFVGKGSKDMEETILKTNLEAVNEIAYQLRFRNIGGLIILDLIDMEQHKNREKVRRTLEDLLQKDKAKTTLNRISELGLIEMTRKRTRESLGRMLHEPCFYCDGTGQLQSKETIAYEILRELRRKKGTLPGYSVVVNAHPAVADVLNGAEKIAVTDAENKYMRKIIVVPRKEYHLEQFDLVGK